MEALIIAAGKGSRLSPYFSPKPLTPIFGLSMIAHIILRAKTAGITHFKIVVGYKANRIMKKIGSGDKHGVKIEYIYNSDWEKGNGVSVYKAKDYFKQNFILLMADHLFDEEILKELVKVDSNQNCCYLCVDQNINGEHLDIKDATKVWQRDGSITNIGKDLTTFNGIDTGIFLCSPLIFDALEKSIAQGEYSLSAGNKILSIWGKLKAVNTTQHFWVDIDDREALQKAKKILTRQLIKPTDGPVSRRLNRRLSVWISTKLCQFNISPNHLTLFSFLLALGSGAFFLAGGYPKIVMAGLLAQLSSVIDGCDGEVARLKLKQSKFGEFLDRTLDRYADGFIILGMTYACVRLMNSELVWMVGFAALIGSFMNSYTALQYDGFITYKIKLNKRPVRFGRDIRLFIIFIGALLNQLFITLIILSLVTNIESIRRLFVLRNEYQLP